MFDPAKEEQMKYKKKISAFNLKGQAFDIWNRLIHLHESPHDIALGLALGVFIGFLPIMGIQMAVVLVFSYPFKNANKVAAVSGVWVTNPLTVIPIYIFIYWVGTFFYPQSDILSYDQLKVEMNYILNLDSVIDQTKGFLALGADVFIPMTVGGAVVGIITAGISYISVKRFLIMYRKEAEREKNINKNLN